MERFPPSQTMGYHIIAGNYTKQYATAFSTYYLLLVYIINSSTLSTSGAKLLHYDNQLH